MPTANALDDRISMAQRMQKYLPYCKEDPSYIVEGRLLRMVGLTLEAEGCQVPIGGRCEIETNFNKKIIAEVVGFSGDKTYLMPVSHAEGVKPGAIIRPISGVLRAPAGESLLGRVLNGHGEPLDDLGPLEVDAYSRLNAESVNPLSRDPIKEPLDVGVRSINALLSIGRGQRIGLFAGSGVGKSVLLGMMAKYTSADVTVVGLIGERGREVKEFIENILGDDGKRRSVVVASPADDPPLLRIHGAMLACAIAEHFRDQGKNVLLLMDSLTRFAQAQREISLSVGEPPATKGYPPSVFAKLPQLVERAGNGVSGGGSITGLYTVLTEGDDVQDPIADSARAILDGHIVLSRRLAEEGHYPAIDIEASISRVMPQISEVKSLEQAKALKHIYSIYQQNRDLINIGAYRPGSDPMIDLAISKMDDIRQFLNQNVDDKVSYAESIAMLNQLLTSPNSEPEPTGMIVKS